MDISVYRNTKHNNIYNKTEIIFKNKVTVHEHSNIRKGDYSGYHNFVSVEGR